MFSKVQKKRLTAKNLEDELKKMPSEQNLLIVSSHHSVVVTRQENHFQLHDFDVCANKSFSNLNLLVGEIKKTLSMYSEDEVIAKEISLKCHKINFDVVAPLTLALQTELQQVKKADISKPYQNF